MADLLPPEFELQKQQLNRQQKMAEALLAQGQQMSAGPAGQMVSGRYVPNSFWQNAQGPINQMIGAYLANKGDEKAAALAQELRKRNQQDIQSYMEAMSPTTQTTELAGPYGVSGTGQNVPMPVATQTKGPDFAKAFQVAYNSYDPALKAAAMDMIKTQKLGEGETLNRFDFGTGQLTPFAQGGTKLAPDVRGAAQLLGITKPIEQWSAAELEAVNQKARQLKRDAGTHLTITDIMGKDIGQVKEILNEGRNQVQAGEMSMNAANKIDQALKSGNINVGPTANVGQYIGQLGDALGYTNQKGQEKLVNTRQAIQGLAQMWASSRAQAKGQGTMTEGESQLYGKISSGELDKISIPELKYMVESTKAQGNYYRQEYERKLNHLRTIPEYKNVIPLYEVGTMPNIQYKPSGNSTVRTKADEIIGGQ